MPHSKHLVVSISGHGFGHVAQTAPILNLLHEKIPQLQLTVRSSVPITHLRSRIHAPFDHLQSIGDIGMVMSSALDVSVKESAAAYRTFHANWKNKVSEEAKLLESLGADAVFSNVGYLPLAGAQLAGIPNVAMCSLNWADIYRHFCGEDAISTQIQSCYFKADAFFRTTPGMTMSDLTNIVPVAPIAKVGKNKRNELNRILDLNPADKLVLVSMGGITSRLPIERWPKFDNVRWLVQKDWGVNHPDFITHDSLPINFSDLLASSDALLCKPGYGSFVEAACCSIPVIYVQRSDWPESPALVAWLNQHGTCIEISRDQSESGKFSDELIKILNSPRPEKVLPNGAEQVIQWLKRKILN